MWASSDTKKNYFQMDVKMIKISKKERPEFEVKPKQLVLLGSGEISVTRYFEEAITGTLTL
jgi:hypothetical protein